MPDAPPSRFITAQLRLTATTLGAMPWRNHGKVRIYFDSVDGERVDPRLQAFLEWRSDADADADMPTGSGLDPATGMRLVVRPARLARKPSLAPARKQIMHRILKQLFSAGLWPAEEIPTDWRSVCLTQIFRTPAITAARAATAHTPQTQTTRIIRRLRD